MKTETLSKPKYKAGDLLARYSNGDSFREPVIVERVDVNDSITYQVSKLQGGTISEVLEASLERF